MAINNTTKYTTDPNTIPVDSASGSDQEIRDSVNDRVIHKDSIASLLNLDTSLLNSGQRASVTGYYSGSSKGGGEFYWDSASTETDNGGTVFQVSGVATGRWVRITTKVSLHDFGAVGDGITDDTPSVQSAFNSPLPISDSSSGSVFRTTSLITVSVAKDISIRGTIRPAVTDTNGVYFDTLADPSPTTIKINVDGTDMVATGVGTAGRTVTNGIVLEGCSGYTLEGCRIENVTYGALALFECVETCVSGCRVDNTGTAGDTFASANNPAVTLGNGISFRNCVSCTANKNIVTNVWQIGISARGSGLGNACRSIAITNNFVSDSSDNAIRLQYDDGGDCIRCTVSGNVIETAAIDGVRTNGSYHTIYGNIIRNVANRGVSMERGSYVNITANVVDGAISGVSLRNDGGCDNITISNNTITNYSGDGGIFVFTGEGTPTDDDMHYISVIGNDLNGVGAAVGGIVISNARQIKISDNSVTGVTRRGINIGAGLNGIISGNTVHDVSSGGIYSGIEVFSTFANVAVTSNMLSNPSSVTATGIKLDSGASKFNVSGNNVVNFSVPIDTPADNGTSQIVTANSV